MDADELVIGQIEGLEQQLAAARKLLRDIRISQRKSGNPKFRFFGLRPLDAARVILKERGKMNRKELEKMIVDGGVLIGKSRGSLNIQISFGLNIDDGKLIADGEYIDIPR